MKNKKKVILSIVIILLIIYLTLILLKSKSTKTEGKEFVEITNELEIKYEGIGSYDIGYLEYESEDSKTVNYSIWYPKKLEVDIEKYPVIVIANGTGATAKTHEDVFRHLASWGFIVIGNEDKNSWTGESTSISLDYILRLNLNENSIFYNKIDTEKIGVSRTFTRRSSCYKCGK